MNKLDYMNSLLKLCTKKQIDFFNKIYPNGPEKKQVARATQQIESTLSGLNSKEEEFKKFISESAEIITELKKEVKTAEHKLAISDQSNKELQELVDRLKNPINTANNEVQERLELLNALESGGVDNWEWYSESIEQYRKQ